MMSSVIRLFAVCLCVFLVACSEQKEHQAIIKTVMSVTPSAADQAEQRTLSGVLQPVDQSVLSFEMPGVVQSIEVNLGDRFEQGEVLAKIDDKVFDLAVKQREGQLSEAQARLVEARLDYERKAKLVETGAVSQAEVDLAKARFDSLKDQVSIAQTQVAIAYEDLADTQLIAPFSGSVAQRHVEPSQQVSPSTSILTIQGSDALEVSVLVPEAMISQISTGDSVTVDVLINRVRTTLSGKIFERGKQAQRANAFPVTIAIDDEQDTSALQAGMSAEVTFTSAATQNAMQGLKAPLSAVAAANNNGHYVLALVEKSPGHWLVEQVMVEVHAFNTDSAVFTPTKPVNKIVAAGVDFLRDGQQVHIADDFPQTLNP